jgi:hypothetical protein
MLNVQYNSKVQLSAFEVRSLECFGFAEGNFQGDRKI